MKSEVAALMVILVTDMQILIYKFERTARGQRTFHASYL